MSHPHFYQTPAKKIVAVSPSHKFIEGMSIEAGKEARREEQRRIIGERIKTIKNLAFDCLAGQYVPRGRARCTDLYHTAVPKLRELGQKGGPEFDRALALLKYTWISPENFKETEALLTI
jgi:hypothetical protein